jgi:hypothetical protein
MFPSRVFRAVSLAVEFATLGEYVLEPPPPAAASPRDEPAFRVDLSGIGGAAGGSRASLAPSTAAGRRAQASRAPAVHPWRIDVLRRPAGTPLPSRRTLRSNAASAPTAPTPRLRKRAGAAPARPQACLVAEGTRQAGA